MTTQDRNNWGVSYSVISFVERALGGHSKVERFKRTRDILFDVELMDGRRLNALLVDEYTLGLAAIHRTLSEFPEIDFIVTGGNWNGYTKEAKDFGRQHSLGVFNIEEFLGALNLSEPKNYYKKDSDGKPIYAYH